MRYSKFYLDVFILLLFVLSTHIGYSYPLDYTKIYVYSSERTEYNTGSILRRIFWFEFIDFLFLDRLPYLGKRAQSTPLLTYSWKENNWIYVFFQGFIPG